MSDSDYNEEQEPFVEEGNGDILNEFELKVSKNFDGLDALISIVSSDEDVEKIVEEFTKYDINYSALASLNDKDLELLGVKHEKSRDELLQSFARLPNQREHYDEVLGNLNQSDYYEQVLSQVLNHLKHLNISLTAAQLKLHLDHPEDVIMDDTSVHSSVFVEKTLNELKRKAESMEVQLIELQTVSF